MTPEPEPIDHAKASEFAAGLILIDQLDNFGFDDKDRDVLALSRAYLARNLELAELQKSYDAAREEIMDLERRAQDDAKHLEAVSARATENYNALAAENARLREALDRILKTEYPDCDGAEQKDGREFCMDQMRGRQCDCFVKIAQAALDARGGAA